MEYISRTFRLAHYRQYLESVQVEMTRILVKLNINTTLYGTSFWVKLN